MPRSITISIVVLVLDLLNTTTSMGMACLDDTRRAAMKKNPRHMTIQQPAVKARNRSSLQGSLANASSQYRPERRTTRTRP